MRKFARLLYLILLLPAMPIIAALPSHDSQGQALPSLAPMLERTVPCIVNIAGKKLTTKYRHPSTPGVQSLGSGVIFDADNGYIVTNNHVIDGASTIDVVLNDGRHFNAVVIGADPDTDIAVIQITAPDLQAIQLGSSKSLRVGDFSIAIGNPFGLSQTVTTGIVSGLGRSGLGIEAYENFIQTDASINPGNSGGALVNLRGELIGINTAMFSGSGGNVGIGFAIPVDMVKTIVQQLIQYGEVKRGHLGAKAQNLTADVANASGVDENLDGAVVTDVSKDSAAERAGLKNGDIIIKINNKPVKSANDVRNEVGLAALGDSIKMLVIRDGKQIEILATVEEDSILMQGPRIHASLQGIQLAELDTQHPSHGHIRELVISQVEIDSPAWRLGLRPGDIITSANNSKISSLEGFSDVLESSRELLLNIRRGNVSLSLYLQ